MQWVLKALRGPKGSTSKLIILPPPRNIGEMVEMAEVLEAWKKEGYERVSMGPREVPRTPNPVA